MAILVTYASKHGSTREIAERIASKLRQMGRDVEVKPVDAAGDISGYDAFVIGGALYYGSWMKEATDFAHHNIATLSARPVWLFSSGPLGEEVRDTQEQPKELAEFRGSIKPRDHRIFFGSLDHTKLSFPEKMVIKAVRAPEGDYRDWNAIDAWAEQIARELAPTGAAAGPA